MAMLGDSRWADADRQPLEQFLRAHVEAAGGGWEEVEPQLYDVLLPGDADPSCRDAGDEILQVAFDPEILFERPGAQLACFGSPLVDRMLAAAGSRGRIAIGHLAGLNLAPQDLAARVRQTVSLAGDSRLEILGARPLSFAQAVFWLEATFVSDQREQEILAAAVDMHHGRHVRHLELLLDAARLVEVPAERLPEARRVSLAHAYVLARDRVARTVAALAGTRARELESRLDRQVARMTQYYQDLRAEAAERRARVEPAGPASTEAIDREERLRIAELRQKSALRVSLRLLNVLVVEQPKLLVRVRLTSASARAGELDLVWDPLAGAVEAPDCPACSRPGFALGLDRMGRAVCAECAGPAPAPALPHSGARRARGLSH
jgi:hypothetical protein